MKYRIIIRPEAEDDLEKAFSWYEDKRKGLGYDFLLKTSEQMPYKESVIFLKKYATMQIWF